MIPNAINEDIAFKVKDFIEEHSSEFDNHDDALLNYVVLSCDDGHSLLV